MTVGDKVENFTLQNQDGKDVSLTDFKGKPVVLFFYPRADTPGCTIESCGFRDAFEKFQKAGIVVLGISRDTVKDQKKFKDKYDFPTISSPTTRCSSSTATISSSRRTCTASSSKA